MKTEYESFVVAIRQQVERLAGGNLKVMEVSVDKNNGVVHRGLMLRDTHSNMAPTVYLEELYREFQMGRSLYDISSDVLKIYDKAAGATDFDVEYFKDFSQIKEHIVYRLVNREKNQMLLRECPYVSFLDLAVVPYVSIAVDTEKNGAILIRKEHLKLWNAKEEELFAIAARNTPQQLSASIVKLEDTLRQLIATAATEDRNEFGEFIRELEESEETIPMYVLSNQINLYGAACMVYDNVVEMFAQELGEDVYILPSSVHEVLIVPASRALPPKEMLEMVREINATQIPPEEVLSDHIYQFSIQQRGFKVL